MSAVPDPGARLERALEVFLAAPPSTPNEAERMLSTHPDLRDLLEPMLVGADPARDNAGERVLGDFRLVREIGRGGMGIVYEAWQRSLDRRVAVKVLAPALVQSPAAIARFRREAAAAGRLRHPNLVEVFGFGSEDGQHFFAMQLVEGESLHSCKALFREPHHAIDLAVQLTGALAHAHRHGLVHRDVKPENILMRDDRTPMLTDFGIASDEALPSLTREGGFLGTLDYASPEQMRGEPVDARTDIWATGVILYELLTGSHPFSAATQEATIKNILTAEPPSLRGHRAISSDLAAVVGRALEKNRARRYASAENLLADLEALQRGAAVSARLPRTPERVMRWARREPWRAVAVAVLAIGLPFAAGAIGFLLAKAPLISAGEQLAKSRTQENLLAAVWLDYAENDPQAGLERLSQIPAIDEAEDVAVARAFLSNVLGRPEEAARAIARFDTPAARLLRLSPEQWLEFRPRDEDDAEACFVTACLVYDKAGRSEDDPETFRLATRHYLRATMMSPAPRANHFVMLAKAAARSGDQATVRLAQHALTRHFGDRRITQYVIADTTAILAPAEALPLFEKLLTAPDAPRARLYYQLGVLHAQLGKRPAAEASYQACVALDPKHAEAWNNLGMLLRARKANDEALAAYRDAVAARPTFAKAWNNLGNLLVDTGDPKGARDAFERALQHAPSYAKALYNLGTLVLNTEGAGAAVPLFEKALVADPRYVKAQINLSTSLNRSGRLEEAVAAAERATELAPKEPLALSNLAQFAFVQGKHAMALQAAERWVVVAPTAAPAWQMLAEVLLAIDDTPVRTRARDAARKAVELAGNPAPTTLLLLARASAACGDRTRAEELLEHLYATPSLSDEVHAGMERLTAELAK